MSDFITQEFLENASKQHYDSTGRRLAAELLAQRAELERWKDGHRKLNEALIEKQKEFDAVVAQRDETRALAARLNAFIDAHEVRLRRTSATVVDSLNQYRQAAIQARGDLNGR